MDREAKCCLSREDEQASMTHSSDLRYVIWLRKEGRFVHCIVLFNYVALIKGIFF